MNNLLKHALVGVVLSVSSLAASHAEDPTAAAQTPAHRPRIGLVLNGGGALGLAHVGALQWLEEHHIPVDLVAGTSMGGLVGGAYATGESPAEIRKLVEGIDWDKMLGDSIAYQDLSFRRKEDEAEFPVDFQFGVKRGIVSQGGYKSGQQIQLLLNKIALPYSQVTDFNDLPIPFGCVATDLVSGKAHVFRSGSLGLALRSTMSLPGIFAPVRTGDAIYADGGLLDNLPVDVAKEMGADITVSIYLQTEPIKPDTPLSAIGVLVQSVSVMIAANQAKSLEQSDVLVTVPLVDYTTMDFQKGDAIVRKGYEAAQSKAAELEKLSVDDTTWQAYLADRTKRIRQVPIPQFVEVSGVSKQDAARIEKALEPALQQPIDADRLSHQLTTLSSDQQLSNFSYGVATSPTGTPGIAIGAAPEVFGRNILRPLLVVDGWDYKNVRLGVGARLTMYHFGGYGAELRNDIILGSEYVLSSEYFRPLNASRRFFVAPEFIGANAPLDLYSAKGLIAQYRNRFLGGRGDIGYFIGRSMEIRAGYTGGDQRLYPDVGNPDEYPRVKGREGETHLHFLLDRFDDPITPMSGFRLGARAEWWDAKPQAGTTFPLAELSMLGFAPISSKSSIYLGASGGSTLEENPGGLPPFSLGGSFHLPAYNTNELLTNQYFLFQGGYVRKLATLSPLTGGRILFFASADVGKAYYLEHVSHLPSDGAVGLIINSFLGPIVLGGAVGDAGHYKFYFEIGKAYF